MFDDIIKEPEAVPKFKCGLKGHRRGRDGICPKWVHPDLWYTASGILCVHYDRKTEDCKADWSK